MPRVHILGASGCGVSSLGEALARHLGIPVFDCDAYYWEKTDPPFIKATDIGSRQNALLADLNRHDRWICSGSMDSWSAPFEPLFTHVIFLYVPREARAERLRQRERVRHGTRILEGGDMHVEHLKFIEWARQYDEGILGGRSLPRREAWLARQRCPVRRIEGDLSREHVLKSALEFLHGV